MILRIRHAILFLAAFAFLCAVLPCPVRAEDIPPIEFEDVSLDGEDAADAPDSSGSAETAEPTARDAFIDDIIALGKQLFDKARGKAQRAHYKSDIYVCKNFTVYLFRQNRDKYRMAEYPETELVIPDNLPANKCRPYAYGILWKDIPAEKGNPFYIAAEFRYDTALSREENMELALAFMREVKRGDFFQMTGFYNLFTIL